MADYTLVVGEVLHAHLHGTDEMPLTICRGKYSGLGESLGEIKTAKPK